MPHATSENMTNGETPSSQTISHLTSYPVVSDAIDTFKSNPYGKKSLEVADGAYQRFGKPVQPYLETPYSYAKPYVSKADELGDKALGTVEGHFPIVKEETGTIVDTAKHYAFWPYNYLSSTWSSEYEKTASHNNRGAGLTTSAMAIVSTELKIASDFFQAVADFLGPKYEESKKKGADYVNEAQKKGEQYKQIGQDKFADLQKQGQQYVSTGQEKAQEYQGKGQQYVNAGQEKGQQYVNAGQEKAQEYQGKAQETGQQAKQEAKGAKEEAQKKAQK